MTAPTGPEKCQRCGAKCLACPCAPCVSCDQMLCSTCELPYPTGAEPWVSIGYSYGMRRDVPIPKHSGPPCREREKPLDPIVVVPEPVQRWRRELGSEELISDDARGFARAIANVFGFAAAGVVAGACVVMMAAAAVFSGELPE